MEYIERINYDSKITIKLVIPSGCNAHCRFCYMKDYKDKINNDKQLFLKNFISSIKYMLDEIGNSDNVSLDITGNEPTYDVDLLRNVLSELYNFDIQSKVSRVTITTNGLNLLEVIPDFENVIDYVNISVHHYNKIERDNIFGCKSLSKIRYQKIIYYLKILNIPTSAICVIDQPIYNFKEFMYNFIDWCKEVGFISLRFRNDVFWKETKFDKYMDIALLDDNFKIIQNENTPDSRWCRLRMNDKFRVFFLHGVKDTSIVTKGIEYVIADDGKCYADFYKTVPIEDYKFKIGKIYDLKGEENGKK